MRRQHPRRTDQERVVLIIRMSIMRQTSESVSSPEIIAALGALGFTDRTYYRHFKHLCAEGFLVELTGYYCRRVYERRNYGAFLRQHREETRALEERCLRIERSKSR